MSEQLDVGEQLRATENVLRNLIASVLGEKLRGDWIVKTGVSQERYDGWITKRETENKKLATGNLETRLLYFADFFDLKTIIMKHWELFKDVFGEKKELEVLLSMLEDFRNPNAHARGLLPYQENLVVGICGEIRARVTRYSSRNATAQDCFPRIDSAYDNHGHVYPPYSSDCVVLKVGDRIELVVQASDPEGLPLEYQFFTDVSLTHKNKTAWTISNRYIVELTEDFIGIGVDVCCWMRSHRPYHARGDYDEALIFTYDVLPIR